MARIRASEPSDPIAPTHARAAAAEAGDESYDGPRLPHTDAESVCAASLIVIELSSKLAEFLEQYCDIRFTTS